jgi:hypothetical protein
MEKGLLSDLTLQVFYVSKEETSCPLIIEIIKIARNLKEKEVLNDDNSATISMKYGKRILITSNVKDFTNIQRKEMIEVVDYNPLSNNILLIGQADPKIETPLHWMIHQARNEVNLVVQVNDKKFVKSIKDKDMVSTEKVPMHGIEFIKQSLKQLRNKSKILIKDIGVIYVGKKINDVTSLIIKDFEGVK